MALFASEFRRFAARRAFRFTAAVVFGVTLAVVVIAIVRSTGEPGATMRMTDLWRPASSSGGFLGVISYLTVVGVGLAATALGGDYRAGTVGTVLTWEPRRVRVALARLAAALIAVLAIYALATVTVVGGWAVGSAVRGSTAHAGGTFWTGLLALIARGGMAIALLSLLTGGVAFLTRGTVGALLGWLVYLIGVEAILGGAHREWVPRLLLANLSAFVQGRAVEISGNYPTIYLAQPGPGAVRVGVVAGLVALLAVAVFARRDVR